MFKSSGLLFLYTESSLHVGSGRGFGAIDLPIQRERTTGYPFIQAGGVKGSLRAALQESQALTDEQILAIFGPENADANAYAGAISIGDARLALFPVRSLAGVFAWVTCLDVLARFKRTAAQVGQPVSWVLPDEQPSLSEAWVNGSSLVSGNSQVVLEEFSFNASTMQAALVGAVGQWLAETALLDAAKHPEYGYYANALPAKLCILNDDAFRDFAQYGTEVQTHIHLDPNTKTVDNGLWTSESLPCDTLLYAPLMASHSRKEGSVLKSRDVLTLIQNKIDEQFPRLNFGGDETTGQGMTALRCSKGG